MTQQEFINRERSRETEKRGNIEVRKVEGEIDEIVCDHCTFHLEQMDTGHWWIGIESRGKFLRINLSTKRNAAIRAFTEFE